MIFYYFLNFLHSNFKTLHQMQGNRAFNKELATMNPESPAFPFVPHPEYPSNKWVAETLSGKGPDKPLNKCFKGLSF